MKLTFNIDIQASIAWLKDFVWRRQFLYALLLVLFLTFIIAHLSIIPPGAAMKEVNYASTNSNFSSIIDNPLYLPHKLVTFVVSQFTDSIRFIRAISIVFFGLCVVALYRILKRWHSDKIALFGASLFAANATVLAVARLASPEVMLFGWAIVIALLLWIHHGTSRKIAPLTLALIATGLLYVPGAPYFFVLLLSLFSNQLLHTFRQMKRSAIIFGVFTFLLIVTPLIYSFINSTELIKSWLLLPESIVVDDILTNILAVPSAFIYKSPEMPLISVGQLPIFDVASGGFFIIGLYAYQKFVKLERTKIMILTALLGIILGALGQVFLAILLVLPFAYSVIGAGISYILDQWYSVFPKNPIARSFGLVLVTIVVIMSMYYQLTRFLIVWTNTPETREVYSHSRLIQ